jgi:hypothetical protein
VYGKIIGPSSQNSYDQLQKQLGFHHPRIHSQYWMKNVHFHFTFPSKHVIVTFVTSFNYVNTIVTYMTTQIYD